MLPSPDYKSNVPPDDVTVVRHRPGEPLWLPDKKISIFVYKTFLLMKIKHNTDLIFRYFLLNDKFYDVSRAHWVLQVSKYLLQDVSQCV